MHFKKLIAAAALAVTAVAGSATTASAAPVSATGASVRTVSVAAAAQDWRHRDNRRWDRDRHRGWDRGRQYNRRHYNRGRVCWTEYRRYQGRVTICRRRR